MVRSWPRRRSVVVRGGVGVGEGVGSGPREAAADREPSLVELPPLELLLSWLPLDATVLEDADVVALSGWLGAAPIDEAGTPDAPGAAGAGAGTAAWTGAAGL